MTEFLTLGIVLGLSAGLTPGPLLALVISETMRHGIRNGLRVAVSPIFTDLPIILLTLFVLAQLSEFKSILGVISLAGAAVILYMGIESMTPKSIVLNVPAPEPKSLRKGILVNLLSPHPYLFWLSVGGAIMNRALSQGYPALLAFIGGFYVALIGAKILLTVLVGRSRSFLSGTVYKYIMCLLGLILCFLALLLLRDGLDLLGVSVFSM